MKQRIVEQELEHFLILANKFRKTSITDDDFSEIRDEFDSELARLNERMKRIKALQEAMMEPLQPFGRKLIELEEIASGDGLYDKEIAAYNNQIHE